MHLKKLVLLKQKITLLAKLPLFFFLLPTYICTLMMEPNLKCQEFCLFSTIQDIHKDAMRDLDCIIK